MADLAKKRVLALGFFDGIHIGHRYLLQKAKALAEKSGSKMTVVTFNDSFLTNLGKSEKEIFLLKEREKILKMLGYRDIIALNPTKEFLSKSKDEFLEYLLSLNPYAVVAGKDYAFGKMAKGNTVYLEKYMREKGVKTVLVNLQKYKLKKISTSNIKRLIAEGRIELANKLLGDAYFIEGKVIKGRGIGSSLGIPTANILIDPMKLVPLEGVYKTKTEIDNKLYDSITNVGHRPTFEDHERSIETLLINQSIDL